MNSHHLLLVASRLRSLARSLRRCGVVSATIDDATALVQAQAAPGMTLRDTVRAALALCDDDTRQFFSAAGGRRHVARA